MTHLVWLRVMLSCRRSFTSLLGTRVFVIENANKYIRPVTEILIFFLFGVADCCQKKALFRALTGSWTCHLLFLQISSSCFSFCFVWQEGRKLSLILRESNKVKFKNLSYHSLLSLADSREYMYLGPYGSKLDPLGTEARQRPMSFLRK